MTGVKTQDGRVTTSVKASVAGQVCKGTAACDEVNKGDKHLGLATFKTESPISLTSFGPGENEQLATF